MNRTEENKLRTPVQRKQLSGCLIALTVATVSICTEAYAEEIKVLVNHAPNSFYETMDKIDTDDIILLSSEEWFSPINADFWVIFVDDPNDNFTLSELGQLFWETAEASTSTLIRSTADLRGGRSIVGQVNDLSKTENGADFQGCVSALDAASFAYKADLTTNESVFEFCASYADPKSPQTSP